MASGIRVFGSETVNSTSIMIDVEFGVLMRISQIPDRVRRPRIRSPEGFLEEPTKKSDLECTSNGTSDGIWNLIIPIRGRRPKIPMWTVWTIRGADNRGP